MDGCISHGSSGHVLSGGMAWRDAEAVQLRRQFPAAGHARMVELARFKPDARP
jgi:hypothetical protein